MQITPSLSSSYAEYLLIEVYMPWANDPESQWPINHDRVWIIYCLAKAKVVGETFVDEKKAREWLDRMNNPQAYPDEFLSDAE